MNEKEVALICKALSDDNRLKMVQLLSAGEMCGCKLLEAFPITQPTLSHHMKILCESGLVSGNRQGKWIHYRLNCRRLAEFQAFISRLECHDGVCSFEKEDE